MSKQIEFNQNGEARFYRIGDNLIFGLNHQRIYESTFSDDKEESKKRRQAASEGGEDAGWLIKRKSSNIETDEIIDVVSVEGCSSILKLPKNMEQRRKSFKLLGEEFPGYTFYLNILGETEMYGRRT